MNLEKKYDSFGNVISDSNPNFEIPFSFVGGLYDKDTKLIRFGARDYDPEISRWTSKEPLGFNGSRNFYTYTNADPVNYVDWSGLVIDKDGNFVKGPIWNKKFDYQPGNLSYELVKKVVIQSFEDIFCISYMSTYEWAFHIRSNSYGPGKGRYLEAVNPNTVQKRYTSKPGHTLGKTITNGHTHMYRGKIYIEPPYLDETIPEGPSQADIDFMDYAGYPYAFIVDLNGDMIVYTINGITIDENLDVVPKLFYLEHIKGLFDPSKCTCKE